MKLACEWCSGELRSLLVLAAYAQTTSHHNLLAADYKNVILSPRLIICASACAIIIRTPFSRLHLLTSYPRSTASSIYAIVTFQNILARDQGPAIGPSGHLQAAVRLCIIYNVMIRVGILAYVYLPRAQIVFILASLLLSSLAVATLPPNTTIGWHVLQHRFKHHGARSAVV